MLYNGDNDAAHPPEGSPAEAYGLSGSSLPLINTITTTAYINNNNNNNQITRTAQIFLILSLHLSLLSIAPGRFSKLYPVSAQSWYK